MKKFFKSSGFTLFWIFAFLDILAVAFNNHLTHLFAKPLLLPVLIFTLLYTTHPENKKTLIITGLFFSFMGDVFLLFEDSNSMFFIFGLVCFLLTHLFYILLFLSIKSEGESMLKKRPYLILLVAVYTAALLFLLIPTLGPLLIPVILYAVILSMMLLCSLEVYHKVISKSGKLFISGAVFFVLSDSLLAINKFYAPVAGAGVFIMTTYCLAQYLIVKGFIKICPPPTKKKLFTDKKEKRIGAICLISFLIFSNGYSLQVRHNLTHKASLGFPLPSHSHSSVEYISARVLHTNSEPVNFVKEKYKLF